MPSPYLDSIRSLEELHRIIDAHRQRGTQKAMTTMALEIERSIAAIIDETESTVAGIREKAERASRDIRARVTEKVNDIRKEAAKSAAQMLDRAQKEDNMAGAARAAIKLLTEATASSAELYEESEKALARIVGEKEAAVVNVKRVLDKTVAELTELGRLAVQRAAGTDEKSEDESVQLLRDACESVVETSKTSTANIRAAAARAIERLETVIRDAVSSVERAIEDAYRKTVHVVDMALKDISADADRFDLRALKEKWNRRKGG